MCSINDFIGKNPNCAKYRSNLDAIHIFEKILCREENVIAMVDAINAKQPALCAVIKEIEDFYLGSQAKSFDLTDDFSKRALGRMVRFVVEPFGYRPDKEKTLPKDCGSRFIKSAMSYKLTGEKIYEIRRQIVKV